MFVGHCAVKSISYHGLAQGIYYFMQDQPNIAKD